MCQGSDRAQRRERTISFAMFWAVLLSLSLPLIAPNELTEEAKQELKKLPPGAQAVIPRRFALDWLPESQWKIQVANNAHGEALDLDDSNWEAVVPSQGPMDAVWHRAWIEFPQDR